MGKKILRLLGIILIAILFLGILGLGFIYFGLRGIPSSHIKGNVPDKEHFDEYLSRDLNTYFSKSVGKDVKVTFELLHNDPFQIGVGSPKFFAWVLVKESGHLIAEGAIKVGANAKKSFTVTNYVSLDEIKLNPEHLKEIFPPDVVSKIEDRSQ